MTQNTKRNLTLDKGLLKAILYGFIIAVVIVIIVQHFGAFYGYHPHTYITSFESPLGYSHHLSIKNPHEYIEKLLLYIKIAFAHFQYIMYFWIPISGIIILLKKFNIKFK